MPDLFSFAGHHNEDSLQEMVGDEAAKLVRRNSLFDRMPFRKIGSFLKHHRDHHVAGTERAQEYLESSPESLVRRPSLLDRVSTERAVPSLPRPQTFRRQQSEQRERLLEVPSTTWEKRAVSADRKRGLSTGAKRPRSPKPIHIPSLSAPEVGSPDQHASLSPVKEKSSNGLDDNEQPANDMGSDQVPDEPPLIDGEPLIDQDDESVAPDRNSLQDELDQRWILNLSMHFRDKSDREKFFVTYAEQPNRWRRLTVSLDYRNAPPDSLEADLKSLHYQRDKSMRIYEAIRDSLPEIEYYNTVTNLKLETTADDGQLHVHVREDANEIVTYPSVSSVAHVRCQRVPESDLRFESHISGFVYKVSHNDEVVIKKEIPGPDTIDEFLYEVNALDSLSASQSVVQLRGLITDDASEVVKGLLISYASKGALVDMLFDYRETPDLPWPRRERWAREIVTGLSEIHEAGFVQGDFTLSNIVIDGDDNAKIIDVNRRGCPVGWEPPELSRFIESGQRIGMCIGVKTDLFQLGMVLWALAEEIDEPEREDRPLPSLPKSVPRYYRKIVESCLSDRPQGRKSAKDLLEMFPPESVIKHDVEITVTEMLHSEHSVSSHRSDKEYIDPAMAVTIDEVRRPRADTGTSRFTSGQVTYADAPSTDYRVESSESYVIGRSRGRSPFSDRRRRSSPYARPISSATSVSDSSRQNSHWEHVCASDLTSARETSPAADSTSYPPGVDLPPAPEPPETQESVEKASRYSRELMPPPPIPGHVWEAHDHHFGPPLHQDSGFDEHMVDMVEAGGEERASSMDLPSRRPDDATANAPQTQCLPEDSAIAEAEFAAPPSPEALKLGPLVPEPVPSGSPYLLLSSADLTSTDTSASGDLTAPNDSNDGANGLRQT